MPVLFPLLLMAAFYFLVVRPQKKKVKAHRALVDALSVGDEVVTAGGLLATIVAAHDDTFEIRLAPDVVVNVLRGAISQKKLTVLQETTPGEME